MRKRWKWMAALLAVGLGCLPAYGAAETVEAARLGPAEEPAEVEHPDTSVGEDGSPYPTMTPDMERAAWAFGKIEPAVEDEAALKEEIDVIIYLVGQATEAVGPSLTDIRALHQPTLDTLGREIQDIYRSYQPRISLPEREETMRAPLLRESISADDRARLQTLKAQLDERQDAMKAEIHVAMGQRVRQEHDEIADRIDFLGGRVHARVATANAVGAIIPSSALLELARDSRVRAIVRNHAVVHELNVSMPTTGASEDPNDINEWWDYDATIPGFTGECGGAYDAGVVDTGVQQNHAAFAGITFYNDQGLSTDTDGHGTHVAGIMASRNVTYTGMAPCIDAMIWGVASGGQAGVMSRMETLMGLAQAPEVINHSLGYNTATLDYSTNDTFYDAFVRNYDIQVTKSAGNGGWGASQTITYPAPAFNILVVANMNDRNTTGDPESGVCPRPTPGGVDDVRSSTSSIGPTANGRRKPDISAPGSAIISTNAFWPGAGTGTSEACRNSSNNNDYVTCSGTSMAAPHVGGAVLLLQDGGNLDSQAQKAVLINTADWWDSAGTSTTADDGPVCADAGYNTVNWDLSYGWGILDMDEAWFNRADYHTASLVPNNFNANEDDYKLYSGLMFEDEKATLVWEKRNVYVAGAPSVTNYGLTDLNLRLYDEADGSLDDIDFDGDDNVHQVAATGTTDAVIKVYAYSSSISGAASESFWLATEENFVVVDFPTTFQAFVSRPSPVQPTEQFNISFWMTNNSTIASHSNSLQLNLPAGWALISGSNPQSVGSAAGGGGQTNVAVWTVQAPAVDGVHNFTVGHSHTSYNEVHGPINYGFGTTVTTDNTPPSPNPSTFATLPHEISLNQISMTATLATDAHGPVEYYHQWTSSPTGGGGGTSSGWTAAQSYTDSGLGVNHEYCYREWAHDNALPTVNQTSPSAIDCDYTAIETPAGINFGTVTTSSIQVSTSNALSGLTRGSSAVWFRNATDGIGSGWLTSNNWVSGGLAPNTSYAFDSLARNGDATWTPWSAQFSTFTLANVPAAASYVNITDNSVTADWTANGNPAGTQYQVQNITLGTTSGWTISTAMAWGGLTCGSTYEFQVRARNGNLVTTAWTYLGAVTIGFNFDGDALPDCIDPDDDNDGVLDGSDCAQFDITHWALPSESQNLELRHSAGVTDLTWAPPALPGTTSILRYDVAISRAPDDWLDPTAACVESDDSDLFAQDSNTPGAGTMYFFLGWAQNSCGVGDPGHGVKIGGGSLPRIVLSCP